MRCSLLGFVLAVAYRFTVAAQDSPPPKSDREARLEAMQQLAGRFTFKKAGDEE